MNNTTKSGFGIRDLIGDQREQVLQLAARYKAYNVRVFGSVARGEARADSDIDFLVDFQPGYKLRDQIGLTVKLRELLGRPVDVAVAKNLRDEFRADILQDATPL
ncbi:MAG: nucleotidyltransferase family protein [Anaerolineae bacterium]